MTAMLYLIILSLVLGAGGLILFLWTLRAGQYEDIEGAANRILFDDTPRNSPTGSDPADRAGLS